MNHWIWIDEIKIEQNIDNNMKKEVGDDSPFFFDLDKSTVPIYIINVVELIRLHNLLSI